MTRPGKAPAFQFYPADFLSDANVVVMTPLERGVYITLLCHCWLEGGLSADEAYLRRLAGVKSGTWRRVRERVLRCFDLDPTGTKYDHDRLQVERDRQFQRRQQKSAAGRKGADSRWHRHDSANGKRMADDGSSSSSSTSSSEKKNPPNPPGGNGQEILKDPWHPEKLPPDLEHPVFREAAEEWVQYRRQNRWKPWKPVTWKKQFKALASLGPEAAAEAIATSIANGWQGLFPGRNGRHHQQPLTAAQQRLMEIRNGKRGNCS